MKIQEQIKVTPYESKIVTTLKEKHNAMVKNYNDLLTVNPSKAMTLGVKIEAIEKQINYFQKHYQDLLEKQSSVKRKQYL